MRKKKIERKKYWGWPATPFWPWDRQNHPEMPYGWLWAKEKKKEKKKEGELALGGQNGGGWPPIIFFPSIFFFSSRMALKP
jgi:hypothetical protein